MTDNDFAFLRRFLLERSGLALSAEKRYLVDSRLLPLCRHRQIASITALVERLKSQRDADIERAVIEAMMTNETFFFRDRRPFELLREYALPKLLEARAASKRLRIWCAAASSGQEPYSICMVLKAMEQQLAGWNVEMLATDLAVDIIDKAKAGLYTQFEVQRGLPIQPLLKHFTQVGDMWQIAEELRAMVQFRTLNLLRDFSSLGTFDVILCRNVLIYFEPSRKSDVLQRLAARLADDGLLFLGAAETVIGLTDTFLPHPDHQGMYVLNRKQAPALTQPKLTARAG
jgi:chemotaxis protein methyltransferase CheR